MSLNDLANIGQNLTGAQVAERFGKSALISSAKNSGATSRTIF
jgi:hypothetical protein